MEQKAAPKIHKAFIIAALMISILCLAAGLLLGNRLGGAKSNHLFWLHSLMVASAVAAIGATWWHGVNRRRGLLRELSEKTEALRKSEDKYRSLVESAEDFIFTVDESGRFQSLNNFTANFFGGTPSQFLGQPISVLFSETTASRQFKLISMVFEFGKSVRDEFVVKTGEHHTWLNANFMPIKDEQERVISVLCIARDITEHKKLESQLVNTEKLASMGTLAAGVAHELNNPLGIMLGFTDLLLEKLDKDSQDFEDLKTIERHSLHCKQVVENLLSFARQGEGEAEYCDINKAIDEIIGVVKHSLEMNDVDLRVELSPGIPKVKGDLRQMQQVLLNLINNAAAAMKGGGLLEIETASDSRLLHDQERGGRDRTRALCKSRHCNQV
jgi:PAS domain S-box-containing protein